MKSKTSFPVRSIRRFLRLDTWGQDLFRIKRRLQGHELDLMDITTTVDQLAADQAITTATLEVMLQTNHASLDMHRSNNRNIERLMARVDQLERVSLPKTRFVDRVGGDEGSRFAKMMDGTLTPEQSTGSGLRYNLTQGSEEAPRNVPSI